MKNNLKSVYTLIGIIMITTLTYSIQIILKQNDIRLLVNQKLQSKESTLTNQIQKKNIQYIQKQLIKIYNKLTKLFTISVINVSDLSKQKRSLINLSKQNMNIYYQILELNTKKFDQKKKYNQKTMENILLPKILQLKQIWHYNCKILQKINKKIEQIKNRQQKFISYIENLIGRNSFLRLNVKKNIKDRQKLLSQRKQLQIILKKYKKLQDYNQQIQQQIEIFQFTNKNTFSSNYTQLKQKANKNMKQNLNLIRQIKQIKFQSLNYKTDRFSLLNYQGKLFTVIQQKIRSIMIQLDLQEQWINQAETRIQNIKQNVKLNNISSEINVIKLLQHKLYQLISQTKQRLTYVIDNFTMMVKMFPAQQQEQKCKKLLASRISLLTQMYTREDQVLRTIIKILQKPLPEQIEYEQVLNKLSCPNLKNRRNLNVFQYMRIIIEQQSFSRIKQAKKQQQPLKLVEKKHKKKSLFQRRTESDSEDQITLLTNDSQQQEQEAVDLKEYSVLKGPT